MIIKHVEFKVICDACYSDITEWHAVPKAQLRKYAKKDGVKLGYMDSCLCEGCRRAMNELESAISYETIESGIPKSAIEADELWLLPPPTQTKHNLHPYRADTSQL